MKNKILIGVLSASVILGGAVAVGAANNDSDAVKLQRAAEGKEKISITEAQKIALSKAEGNVESVELESRLGQHYYDVDIENGDMDYDIHIDAYTGEVKSVKEERNDDDDQDDRDEISSNQNIISEQEAIEIAEKAVNGTVSEMNLDEDDDQLVYEFELNKSEGEAEVEIDAVTGKVLEIDHDNDDKNDDDNDQDD